MCLTCLTLGGPESECLVKFVCGVMSSLQLFLQVLQLQSTLADVCLICIPHFPLIVKRVSVAKPLA